MKGLFVKDINLFKGKQVFSEALFEKMKLINTGIEALEFYEFQYALDNLIPAKGWESINLLPGEDILIKVNTVDFYQCIHVKPREGGQSELDKEIELLTQMLFVGLVKGDYLPEWVDKHFYFDIRGFYFLVRTSYFTEKIIEHLNKVPYRTFNKHQQKFEKYQAIGYKSFKEANQELDQFFIESVQKIIKFKGTPLVLAIAGSTAAGKTEIVTRLQDQFFQLGISTSTIELDNFLTDRDYREEKGIDSLGKEALHFELFLQCFREILLGQKIFIPRYDFINATSSHDLTGTLKPGCQPIEIEAADIVFIEGNSPFLISEAAALIAIKVVYLTDDHVRMKRKWKRDMDYRKKYELNYFRNRYFKDQFLMAEYVIRPQMEICDLVVDTSGGALWTTADIAVILNS